MQTATATKIPVSRIEVTRAEGPVRLCRKRSFNSLAAASAALLKAAPTYPPGGCYDKHDFKITFADGETYEGRLDCQRSGETATWPLMCASTWNSSRALASPPGCLTRCIRSGCGLTWVRWVKRSRSWRPTT